MDLPDKKTLQVLGLTAEDVAGTGESISLGEPGVSYGLSVMPDLATDRVDAAIAELAEFDVTSRVLAAKGVRAVAYPTSPRLVVLEVRDHRVWTAGPVRRRDDGLLVLGGAGSAGQQPTVVINGGAPVMVWFDQGMDRVNIRDLRRNPANVPLEKLSGIDFGESGAPPPLDIATILGGFSVEPWLMAEASHRASSPLAMDRCVAAGLVARMWVPSREHREEARAMLLAGRGPGRNAIDWYHALSVTDRRLVEDQAVSLASMLGEGLDSLCEHIASRTPGSRDRVFRLLLGRDDLECVLLVVNSLPNDGLLREAIDFLDERATSILTALGEFDFSDETRLSQVAWQHPDAWWGALAGPR